MSPEARKLKMTSLITMFAGLAVAVLGVVLLVMDADVTDAFVLVGGLITTLLGAQAARVANVPSNAKSLLVPSGIVTAADAAAGAGAGALAAPIVPSVILLCVAAVLALAVLVVAGQVKKALERV